MAVSLDTSVPRVTLTFTDGTSMSLGMSDAELAQVIVFLYKTHEITLKPLDENGAVIDQYRMD